MLMSLQCPFCEIATNASIHNGALIFAIWDRCPVSPGHALIIPRRHCATWFDATLEEQTELLTAVDAVRQIILDRHQPDGFNIGINLGEAAGQTVPHLHLHVIPRYIGDVEDATGGVRSVIPGKANYLSDRGRDAGFPPLPHTRALVCGAEDPMLPHLKAGLDQADAVDIAVAFTLENGLHLIFEHLRDLLNRRGRLRFLTGDYLDVTEPTALLRLLDLKGDVQLRIFETGGRISFHPKAIIFRRGDLGCGYVGSSNLSSTALGAGIEWNLRFSSTTQLRTSREVFQAYEALFAHPCTRKLDEHWIREYVARRRVPDLLVFQEAGGNLQPVLPPEPHDI
jgi:HKD family nuclease/diadenosine tetraphosphate (Ap4A) HIT family hydrolase